MKKNRNTFFAESQSATMNVAPQMPMMQQAPMMQAPMQAAQSEMSFYSGPAMPNNMMYQNPNPMMAPVNNLNNDIENRIAKLERQIHRLETRINKLESGSQYAINNEEYNSSMYMI